jgi:hypothetical protein
MLVRHRVAVVAFFAVSSCSANDQGLGTEFGSSAGGSAAGGSGGMIGVPGGSGGSGGSGTIEAGTGGNTFNPDAACEMITAEGKRAPSNVVFVVDYSWSMCFPPSNDTSQCAGGYSPPCCAPDPKQSKWHILKQALLSTFDQLPEEAAVGLSLYPTSGVCGVATSPAVPVALLSTSGQRDALVAGLPEPLDNDGPINQTPTAEALFRMAEYMMAIDATLLPGSRSVVLITDGKSTCNQEHADVIGAATHAINSGIRTFVVGVPGSEAFKATLSETAQVGGTGESGCSHAGPSYCHFDMTAYSTPDELGANLLAAFGDIKGQIVSCVYDIPQNPEGGTIDYSYINVRYTPGDGSVAQDLLYDEACQGPGWHYDAPTNPSKIHMCPETCEALKADLSPRVDVLFGCPTYVK